MADNQNTSHGTILKTVKSGDNPYRFVFNAIAARSPLDPIKDKSLINEATHAALPEILELNEIYNNRPLQKGDVFEISVDILYKHLPETTPLETEKEQPTSPKQKTAEKTEEAPKQQFSRASSSQAFRTTEISGTIYTVKKNDNYTRIVQKHLSGKIGHLSAYERHKIEHQLIAKTKQSNGANLQPKQKINIPNLSHKRFQNHAPKQNYTPVDNGHNLDKNIDTLITEIMRRSHVPEGPFRGLIFSESGGDPNAISSTGAMGLGQLKPKTAWSTAYKYVNSQDYKDAIDLDHETANPLLEKLAANITKTGDNKYSLKSGFSEQEAKEIVLDPRTNLTLTREYIKTALSEAHYYLGPGYENKEFNLLELKFIYMCGGKDGAKLIKAKDNGKLNDSVEDHLSITTYENNKNFFSANGKPLTVGETFEKMRQVLREKTLEEPDGKTAKTIPADLDQYKSEITIESSNPQLRIGLNSSTSPNNALYNLPISGNSA